MAVGGPQADDPHAVAVPRVIWMLWLQGWHVAPELVQACAETWRRWNPGWTVRRLDRAGLEVLLPSEAFVPLAGKAVEPEAFSDVARLELLARYGGVWADATVYCLRPLDEWLPARMTSGFFAFARPGPDRMLSSWFLATAQGGGIVRRWRQAARDYWAGRASRDHYFWIHRLFAACHAEDPCFRAAWDAVPAISATGPHRFEPYLTRLVEPPTAADEAFLAAPDVPVLKLTHKRPPPEAPSGSAARRLCDMAWTGRAEPAAAAALRVLVAWYGSFAGHGTIGDLLSLESVVARLVAEGWGVAHLSAADVVIPGATRVEDADFDPAAFGAVVFVCGPIIAGHPQTESLFARCRGRPLVGVGVSLFTPDHASHADPFTTVLARQGGRRPFEDVALVAPSPALPPRKALPGREQVIGLALRGPQGEYGADACLWERTERLARVAAERLLERSGGRLELIENHLARSGRRPEEIESQYARCDLVITSRFHGAMLALRHGVPFVAIDQIRGGGKVEPLLAGRGWPHVFRAEDAGEEDVARAAAAAIAVESRPILCEVRGRAVVAANRTLAALATALAAHAQKTPL
jgi:hypothetical protein